MGLTTQYTPGRLKNYCKTHLTSTAWACPAARGRVLACLVRGGPDSAALNQTTTYGNTTGDE